MRCAPSFIQPPAEEAIGLSVKATPANWVSAYVIPEFVTPAEEHALLSYVDPWFDRVDYNDAHADGLIHHYKEFYRSYIEVMEALAAGSSGATPRALGEDVQESPPLLPAAQRALVRSALTNARAVACKWLPQIPIDDRFHCLRLAGSGFIRAHVDENRNSSGIIGGLCLGAGRVMALTHPQHPGERVDMLLAPRCFYVMIGRARYEWEHSVDWTADDDEHIRRIQKSLVVEDTPIEFDGADTGLRRKPRTAIIFRGVSPAHLFAQRVGGASKSQSNTTTTSGKLAC